MSEQPEPSGADKIIIGLIFLLVTIGWLGLIVFGIIEILK